MLRAEGEGTSHRQIGGRSVGRGADCPTAVPSSASGTAGRSSSASATTSQSLVEATETTSTNSVADPRSSAPT
eukprot:6479444-Amphidinium_carterae.1